MYTEQPSNCDNNDIHTHSLSSKKENCQDTQSLGVEGGIVKMKTVDAYQSLEDVEALIGECSKSLKEVKENGGGKGAIQPLLKVELGLDLVRQRLLCCAYAKLSAEELKSFDDLSGKPADPSVQFFGLEWTSVFSRCYALGVEVRLFKAGLEQDYLSKDRLQLCLSLIKQLTTELEMHVAAVKFDRLAPIHHSVQLMQQQQHVTNIGRAASFKQVDLARPSPQQQPAAVTSRRQASKYTGSKTDSVLVGTSSLAAGGATNKPVSRQKKKAAKVVVY